MRARVPVAAYRSTAPPPTVPPSRRQRAAEERLALRDHRRAPDVERRPLVQRRRRDVQHRPLARRGDAAGLLGDERQRVRLVHQPQLAVRVARVRRVDVDPALDQVAVEVRHERADVARRVRPARRRVLGLHPLDVLLQAAAPRVVVALVGRVHAARLGRADAGVRQQELADRGVEREAVDARPSGVDQHRRGAVEDVARRDLLAAGLERARHRHLARVVLGDLVDREDGPDGDVDVDVGRAVERVEEDDVLALAALEEQRDRLGVLLGADEAHLAAAAQRADVLLVREQVQLLLDLVLHVDRSGVAEKVNEPGLADVAVDDLGGDGDVAEQTRELSLGAGHLVLSLDDELLEGLEVGPAREGGLPVGRERVERRGGRHGEREKREAAVAKLRRSQTGENQVAEPESFHRGASDVHWGVSRRTVVVWPVKTRGSRRG